MRFTRFAAAFAAAGAMLLSGCAGGGAVSTTPKVNSEASFEAGTTMDRLNRKGKIRVGTKFDQPLFGLMGPDGKPEGFDVEIARIVAGALGIDEDGIEWVEAVSANREPFIQKGEVDIVVATYTANDERKRVVSFAGPYYVAGQDLLVLKGNPEVIGGIGDVRGKRVCSVTGSTSAQNLKDMGVKVLETDTYSNCLSPLRQGQVVAVSTDNVILGGLTEQNPGEFELVEKSFTEEPYGIGIRRGDEKFRSFLNDTLEAAFEDGRWKSAWEKTAGRVLRAPEPPKIDRS